MNHGTNPLTGMDYPDPDVIRVNDTYYMISTTMHFFPGAVILKSYDLIHWEFCSYVFDALESTTGEIMEGTENIYGHGMWAASLRYHLGRYYVVFIAHEWNRTFLYTADHIDGPWRKQYIDGIYHDPSLLFDDGKVFIVYGNRNIRMTELQDDLSGPKEGGFDKIIVRDAPGDFLGYEGSHIYKINGKYVLFLIHSRPWKWFRTQACFIADDLGGTWAGGDVLEADFDHLNSGVAQGGIVDTPTGKWFAVLFQDHGAVGRVPMLVPVTWNRFGYPIFGPVTRRISNECTRPGYQPKPLFESDSFGSENTCTGLKSCWQFNHEPRKGCYETGNGYYRIVTDKTAETLESARNTITQRTVLPRCAAEVTVDAGRIKDGDTAGLCLLSGTFGLIGVRRNGNVFELVMKARTTGKGEEKEYACIPADGPLISLRAEAVFNKLNDEVRFLWRRGCKWEQLGPVHSIRFTLDHFCGCRFGLFLYAQKEIGGIADFYRFIFSGPDRFHA